MLVRGECAGSFHFPLYANFHARSAVVQKWFDKLTTNGTEVGCDNEKTLRRERGVLDRWVVQDTIHRGKWRYSGLPW